MVLFNLLVISLFCAISATEPQIERQNSVDNYDSLNRYKPTDSSSYSTSGGYYPRNVYEQLNHNRYNSDLSGREFRPPNVFAAGLISTPTPYVSPLMAQPRQYQVSLNGPSGLMPYGVTPSPLMQSSGYSMGGSVGNQYSGLNGGAFGYGGVPTRVAIGGTAGSIGQGYGYGGLLSMDPYSGIGNRHSFPMNPYSLYGGQGLYSTSPYFPQSPNYQSMSYGNPMAGYLNRGQSFGFGGPQYGAQSYQSLPFYGVNSNSYSSQLGSQLGQNRDYSNYNNYNNDNYNSNSGLGSTQNGLNEAREESKYSSSASTQTETLSGGAQSSDEIPVFHSTRMIRRNDIKKNSRSDPRAE